MACHACGLYSGACWVCGAIGDFSQCGGVRRIPPVVSLPREPPISYPVRTPLLTETEFSARLAAIRAAGAAKLEEIQAKENASAFAADTHPSDVSGTPVRVAGADGQAEASALGAHAAEVLQRCHDLLSQLSKEDCAVVLDQLRERFAGDRKRLGVEGDVVTRGREG